MGHVFELSDEQYARLESYARKQGQSPEEAFQAWVASLTRQPSSRAKKGTEPRAGVAKEPAPQPAQPATPPATPGDESRWDERRGEAFAQNDLDDFANDE